MMKWILAILLFISASAIGQSDDTDKYIWYKYQYGSRMPRFWADSVLKAAGLVKFTGISSSVDTTTYKPLARNSSGDVRVMGGWPGSGGGGGVDTIQVHTSGTTVTVSTGVNILYVDPASTLATLTITLPATPNYRGTLDIFFGGTLTSGNVVTAITISPNSGQTKLEASTPGYVEAGEHISYQYRVANTKWYRKH